MLFRSRDGLDIVWDQCEKMKKAMEQIVTDCREIQGYFAQDIGMVKAWSEGN